MFRRTLFFHPFTPARTLRSPTTGIGTDFPARREKVDMKNASR
jgi:hypothetical protein